MIIDITKMFNYQLICNESYVVGTIHSYVPSMISLNHLASTLVLNRKTNIAHIINASLVEE